MDNRRGTVRVNGSISREFILLAGVPQGSLLAPILYIFYIKDLPTKVFDALITSFYADNTSYADSDTLHKRSKSFVADHLQPILVELENFCSKWRMGIIPDKTVCLNFFLNPKNNNSPRLWLKGNPIKYERQSKFLGIIFDEKLSYETHIENIVSRCHKRMNLLKAIKGMDWGANPNTILYTYKTYIRPIIEYGSILFAHADQRLLKKLQSIETTAIKIAYRLPTWSTNHWCYKLVTFDKILDRLKQNAKSFLDTNVNDDLVKPLIEASKPSNIGHHSAIYKALNW